MACLDKSRLYMQLGQRARLDEFGKYNKAYNTSGTFQGNTKASVVTTECESDECASMPHAALISPRSTDNAPHSFGHDRNCSRDFVPDSDRQTDANEANRSLSPPLTPQERKRRRVAEQHNKSEQRRRRKINTKLEELQAMVPFSRSREKAAILLDVIEYIKSVQAQLHIMSAITACDYASHQATAAMPDPFLSATGFASQFPAGGTFPAPPIPPAFPVARPPADATIDSSGLFLSPGFGFPGPSLAPGKINASGGEDRGQASGSGWSFSSGESSAPFGAVVDNTASSYDQLLF